MLVIRLLMALAGVAACALTTSRRPATRPAPPPPNVSETITDPMTVTSLSTTTDREPVAEPSAAIVPDHVPFPADDRAAELAYLGSAGAGAVAATTTPYTQPAQQRTFRQSRTLQPPSGCDESSQQVPVFAQQ